MRYGAGLLLPHPERRAPSATPEGLPGGGLYVSKKRLDDPGQFVVLHNESVGKHDLKTVLAGHERYRQQVLLGPMLPLDIGITGVVSGQKDVVQVNQNAGLKHGQHFEKEHGCVGVHEYAVRAIHENDVSLLELVKEAKVNVL